MAIKQIEYDGDKYVISYTIVNPKSLKDIVFLHGWGSNKEIMIEAFKNELNDFRHIYIDLPGFGNSTNRQTLKSFEYANIISLFLKTLQSDLFIVVGHSFGGKIATLLNPTNLVLLSSAGIVEEKTFLVKLKIAIAKLLNSFGLKVVSKAFRSKDAYKMSENMYGTFKNVVDEDFRDIFRKFKKNTIIFWGKEDRATSLVSGQLIASLIDKSKFYICKGDHYFFLNNQSFISQHIKDNICNP